MGDLGVVQHAGIHQQHRPQKARQPQQAAGIANGILMVHSVSLIVPVGSVEDGPE